MDLEKENIRLIEQNRSLIQENEYLKMLLERFIPMPINRQVESLKNKYSDIDKRLSHIEDMSNKAK